ncbi:3-hydroxyisobutyrate dehydrogenase [Streptomyces sp. 3213]|uniref:NAD(P)-dependent oxidoreductase n=1 Tax=Streptomyces sp. 3213.3 TaxID=1855348 RepID=UPI000898CA44|nr:NAD(P)-dependent oxidoreductase [Streptomyces sp. 3213.3]SEC82398.1 3-hydroxyisobutyrate dehydrogenase [Streptomyces sp. 3213] [Streptomyces sp. 3213.3]
MTVQAKTAQTKIAVLGVGVMGAPMARNLLRAGFDVHVWNRTRERAEALAAQGARVASSPAEAASDADLLITMLTDGPAVESAMTGSEGALATLPSQAVWVQMSTVGTSAIQHLAELAGHAGQRVAFVDAPVSGSSEPAEKGELLILASGNLALRPRVQPLFDAVGRQTLWLDRVGDGSRLKLVLNNWLAVLAEGMAETMSLTTALGLDPDQVLETLSESPLGSAYAVTKGHAMVQHDFTPGFPLRHAAKDIALALSAAGHNEIDLPLTEAVLKRWYEAIADGHGDEDVAAAITAS